VSKLHSSCIGCFHPSLADISGYKKAGLCECKSCGLVFSKKIPTKKELEEHYDKYERNDFLSPITIKRYQELLDEFEKYRKTGNLLDVGCGIGYFLEQAKIRGWKVYGTEFTDEAINICQNKEINMHKGVLTTSNYVEKFDVITSFEVLEHINNPMEEIGNFSALIRPGGLLYCTTPNFNSLSRRLLQQSWNNIVYPEHLTYFTVKTLSKLLSINSIFPIKKLTTGISISRYKSSKGIDNQQGVSVNSDDELLRTKMDKQFIFRVVKTLLNIILTWFSLGDTIKIYALKE
jgi:2-polyprenyl-3-methyl-5-hydroxy-6-metoxy-1,4-benzoquinol methylase